MEKRLACYTCSAEPIRLKFSRLFDRCLPCWMRYVRWLEPQQVLYNIDLKEEIQIALKKYLVAHPEEALEI